MNDFDQLDDEVVAKAYVIIFYGACKSLGM